MILGGVQSLLEDGEVCRICVGRAFKNTPLKNCIAAGDIKLSWLLRRLIFNYGMWVKVDQNMWPVQEVRAVG